MQSNWLLDADPLPQEVASPQGLRSGLCFNVSLLD